MLDHGPTQHSTSHSYWQMLSGQGAALMHRASHGLGFGSAKSANVTGLGTRLSVLKPGNPAIAQEMSRGIFSFAGTTVTAKPVDVFDAAPPNAEWVAALHNLSWLQHFVAGGHELHRIVARTMVLKWSTLRRRIRTPTVNFQALLALSSAAHFLVGPSPSSFDMPFFALVEKLIHRTSMAHAATPDGRLWQAVALQYASLAFQGSPALRDQANAKFSDVVDKIILPDGGHVSRNPQRLLEILLAIIPLKHAMTARREAVPQSLSAAIERMFPMLRMLSHGDLGLANFQGTGATDMDCLKAALDQDISAGRPLLKAPYSGYCRLSHQSAILLMDTGIPAECNSPLALEFSDGPHRIFSNCGMPHGAAAAWRKAAADIAAHNTVEVASFESGTQIAPDADVISSPLGSLINAANEISSGARQVSHRRNVFLSQEGDDLRGEDHVVPRESRTASAAPFDFTIRFHLHPEVKATLTRKRTRIVIMLPNKSAWQFMARGGAMTLEDSVFLGGSVGPRKTQQIVIRGSTDGAVPVNWALHRVEKPAQTGRATGDMPRLPF
jgi:uncharacterized heparinase superfamily protein